MSKPHGYPLAIFPEEVDNKYKCTYCTNILRNPLQSFCGHRFCKDCIQFLVSEEKRDVCPSCANEGVDTEFSSFTLEQTFPDMAIKRELYSMRTVCSFHGCQWSGSFKEFELHYTTCEHREMDCKCGLKYPVWPLSREWYHLKNECLLREVACPYCPENFIFKYKDAHNEICRGHPVVCETCHKYIPRDQIAEHRRRSHGQQTSESSLYQCGIPVGYALERNLKRHAEFFEQILKRQRTLEAALETTETSFVTASINRGINERIASVEDKIRSLQEERLTSSNAALISTKGSAVTERPRAGGQRAEIVPVEGATGGTPMQLQSDSMQLSLIAEKMPIYEAVIRDLNRKVEKLMMEVETLKSQHRHERDHLDEVDRREKSSERTVALMDVTMSDIELRVSALELESCEGTLLWKITDFSRKRQEAISGRITSIYSPAFYTSKTGYKMCSRMYLNGDGMGKGTHVSLFFVIMRGEHDDFLQWPFRHKVTLMFLDQSGKEQHVMDAFQPDTTNPSYKKPAEKMNIASGCPSFMSLAKLNSLKHDFVKDDVALLKIIVDCDDLN